MPIKQISRRQLKRFSKPWITQGIRGSIKTKKKLFASGDQTKYKFYRNKINHLIRISKRGYFHDYFEKKLQNMKNNLLNCKSKKSRHVNAIKDFNNGNKINRNPQRIANILNEHFASVGEKLASRIPASGDHRDFLKKNKSPSSSFMFKPVTAREVELERLALPNNKSHGLYSCPTKLLKYSGTIISDILDKIVNLSVTSGNYPSKLKKVKVILVFKTEDETDANNYRPISLLSIFDRIFEKVMYKRMMQFINVNNILFSAQYGFREGFLLNMPL